MENRLADVINVIRVLRKLDEFEDLSESRKRPNPTTAVSLTRSIPNPKCRIRPRSLETLFIVVKVEIHFNFRRLRFRPNKKNDQNL